ncbi:structure-specific endonuclease subunit SLX4 isoform X2 [Ambystoma mexicanum]|uniref:structure-specific endonuclease subunit SLX4 isoform X2 n=1 Tax=Ambystoma mexicanum TaxID=8296 RepID=UPI0037E7904D
MDDSDDEFKELCAKLLRRVKRNATEGDDKVSRKGSQNGTRSTTAKPPSKNPKPATKSKSRDVAARKKGKLFPPPVEDSKVSNIDTVQMGRDEQTAGRTMAANGELLPGVSLSAYRGGNVQQRPQPACVGNGCHRTTPPSQYEKNPGAMQTGDTNIQDIQSDAAKQSVSTENQSIIKAAPVLDVQSAWDTEIVVINDLQPAVHVENCASVCVLPQKEIGSARAKNVPPQAATEMPETDHIHRQASLRTTTAPVICHRVVDHVLERMQQFKRADPKRMKCSTAESPTAESDGAVVDQERFENATDDSSLPVMENDRALALALQQDTACEDKVKSLEEEGLYFCQLCQKDLSAMNSALRQQHMNRCLDDVETPAAPVSVPAAPRIPDCPICGKKFNTSKSRSAHLKRCAVTMQVAPQLLLQAVQMQTLDSEVSLPPMTNCTTGRTKRKGSAKETAPSKKHKPSMETSQVEDMLVALVMSRSLLEQESQDGASTVTNVKSEVALPIKRGNGAEKKSRKKKKEVPPPPLLIQDPETAIKHIQNRVAALLTEEMELACAPSLPASRFWDVENLEIDWLHSIPAGRDAVLWQCSSLTGLQPIDFFYAKELVPPISPCTNPQNQKKLAGLPLPVCDGQQLAPQAQTSSNVIAAAGKIVLRNITDESLSRVDAQANRSQQCVMPSCNQRDQEALQDLMELASEGITLTQWKLGADQNPSIEASGQESLTSEIAPSGFVPTPKGNKKRRQHSYHHSSLPLGTLAADFGGMVNNPHLSDVQFQMDSGDVLYGHLFVLYARCPRLVELVHDEGFLVEEDGDARSRRVLLNDVATEAACSFLRYLYCASTDIATCSASDVAALSVRFGVSELLSICENKHLLNPDTDGLNSEAELFSDLEENNEENRQDNFQELLKSMWVDEDEEVQADLEAECPDEEASLQENDNVDEEELEEIYEFAATQRKAATYASEEDTEGALDSDTENNENIESKSGYTINTRGLSSAQRKEKQENLDQENLFSAQQDSTFKDSEFHMEATEENAHCRSAQAAQQSNQSRCANATESTVLRPEEKGMLSKAVENAVDEHMASLSRHAFGDDHDIDSLKDASSSRYSHVGLDDSYNRLFSDTWGEYMEPSQADNGKSVQGLLVNEKSCERSNSSFLLDELQETMPSEASHCKSLQIGRTSTALPALGLPPETSNPNEAPLSQRKQSPFKSPGKITSALFKKSPQSQCLPSMTPELDRSRTPPSKRHPLQQSSPLCEDITEVLQQSSPQSPCLLFPSPDKSKTLPSIVTPQRQHSPLSSLERIRKKIDGSLFSAEAVSELKRAVRGIALSYTTKMKLDSDSPAKSPSDDLSRQSTNHHVSSFNVSHQKHSSSSTNNDIIILLDSDEETELEQHRIKSSSHSPCDINKNTLESASSIGKVEQGPKSVEPEAPSVFDFDVDKSISGLASKAHCNGNPDSDGCSSSEIKLHLSCDDCQSHEETCSSAETSWLVPATPLLSRSKDCLSHTTSFQNLSWLSQKCKPLFKASSVEQRSSTCVNNLTTNMFNTALNVPFRSSLTAQGNEEDSSHSLHRDPTTQAMSIETSNMVTSPPNSEAISPVYSSLHPPDFNNRANNSHEMVCSPTQVHPVELSQQTEPSDDSAFEVDNCHGDHVVVPLPSSGSVEMDFELPIPVDNDGWDMEYLTPVGKDTLRQEDHKSTASKSPHSRVGEAEIDHWKSPVKHMDLTGDKHAKESTCHNNSGLLNHESALQNSKLSFLNTNLWEDWDREEDDLPVFVPLSQPLSTMSPPKSIPKLQTPVATFRKKNMVPEVPITPLPSYSDMDTPKLKKELDRFGVRPLPKRQMVLKLKEIFQYTHQTMSSDSEEETQARVQPVFLSQPMPSVSSRKPAHISTAATKRRKEGISSQPLSDSSFGSPPEVCHRRFKKPTGSKKTSSVAARKKPPPTLSPAKSPLKDRLPCITASQESTASSAAGSDISFESQSSTTNEFETAFASGEEDEEEESITPSQAAVQEKDKTEAVRRYLRLNPELYQKILLYEPIELAGLQAELKQNGIKIPMGKLLDFLDTNCITFTTAASRKEKLEKKQQKQSKKKVTAKRY